MLFTKKIKHILLLVFLVINLASCEKECFEAGDFGSKTINIFATDRSAMGIYSDVDGGQIRSWMDTGLKSNGEPFIINISGGWSATNQNAGSQISALDSCKLCFKKINLVGHNDLYENQCACGPQLKNSILKSNGKLNWREPDNEPYKIDGITPNDPNSDQCNQRHTEGNYCSCYPLSDLDKLQIFSDEWISFPLKTYRKSSTISSALTLQNNPYYYNDENCAFKMGVGAYISLWGRDGNITPKKAYHLASVDSFCPISLLPNQADATGNLKICSNGDNKDMTKVTFRSKNSKIFVKCYGPNNSDLTEEEQNQADCIAKSDQDHGKAYYHKPGEVVKITIYDQYYLDNSGGYSVEFLGGIQSATPDGLIASIVKEMDGYLFGSRTYDTGTQSYITREGVVQFMYKKIINDNVAKRVILISLILYITFFGLSFFMGLVDYGKKEVMMRLLKIGLVVAFTNPTSWSFYNTFVVTFFKNGMDILVNVITDIFQSNMQPAVFNSAESTSGVARKFIYIDDVILTLISKSTISKIFGLLFVRGKELFAIIYIPVIFYLIYFFISTMLDVALKYLINLFKICIGLALGPVFILFSLFEKTKDMFNNWLAFLGARSLEIVILFTMLHPFLTIIDLNFKSMLAFRVCSKEEYNFLLGTYNVNKSEIDRSLFAWFEYFLKIGSLIFITKSVCNQAAYISGQLISIGGVANADPVTEVGKGASGFKFASSIVQGMKSMASQAMGSQFGGKRIAHAGRMVFKGLTRLSRTEIGNSGSINDMVNNTFKYFGIRNRGIRSLLRDRQIDSAIATASASADKQGLKGEDRDTFIRGEAMSTLTQFSNNNKNHALALGLDNHNIQKRFEQKLVKEPLKNFIAEKAKELKEQGIFGKEARDKIGEAVKEFGKEHEKDFRSKKEEELKKQGITGIDAFAKVELAVQEWAKTHRFERKVSDFMKKRSMQNYIKSNAEMSASEAAYNVKNILKDKSIPPEQAQQKAENFIQKFRENAIQNRLDINSEREDRKREGGAIAKVTSVGINLVSKILKPVAVPLAASAHFVGSSIYNRNLKNPKESLKLVNRNYKLFFSKNNITSGIGKKIRKGLGRLDNVVLGAKDHVAGLIRGPFIGEGALDRNPRKNLRKFDRKLARILHEEVDKKIKSDKENEGAPDQKEKVYNSFEELAKKEKILGEDGKLVKIDQEKILGKYFRSDYIKSEDSILKSVGKGFKIFGAGVIYPAFRPVEILLRRTNQLINPEGVKQMKKLHKDSKLEALRSVFDDNKKLVDDFVNKKTQEYLISPMAQKKNGETDQAHQERVENELKEKIKEANKYNIQRTETEERMALALKELKKSAVGEVKKEMKKAKEEVNKDKTKTSNEKLDDLKSRYNEIGNKLHNLDNSKEETVFERLAKIDYFYGTNLISESKDNLNKKIESLSDEEKIKLEDSLKNKLLIDQNKSAKIDHNWKFEVKKGNLWGESLEISPDANNKSSNQFFDEQKNLAREIIDHEIDEKIKRYLSANSAPVITSPSDGGVGDRGAGVGGEGLPTPVRVDGNADVDPISVAGAPVPKADDDPAGGGAGGPTVYSGSA